jgi:hypothetical protein
LFGLVWLFYGTSVDLNKLYYPLKEFSAADLSTAGANPTAIEYRTIMRNLVTVFSITNITTLTNLTDAQLPCAGGNPTAVELRTGFNRADKSN